MIDPFMHLRISTNISTTNFNQLNTIKYMYILTVKNNNHKIHEQIAFIIPIIYRKKSYKSSESGIFCFGNKLSVINDSSWSRRCCESLGAAAACEMAEKS